MRFMIIFYIIVIVIYCFFLILIIYFCLVIRELLLLLFIILKVFIGDFNVNWLNIIERVILYSFFIIENYYWQFMFCYIIDNKICIDYIYINMDEDKIQVNVWEIYFFDYKVIYVLINGFQLN